MLKKLNLYLDKRILSIFLNGVASGFPWVIIGSAMTLWLKDAGLTRTAIGFFGSIFAVYSINWLWAPILDRVELPIIKKLGKRRSWLLLLQSLLFILIALISLTNPYDNLIWISSLAFGIALLSSTQDIVIDAYRIDIISKTETKKISIAASMATSGWWVGYGFVGAIALYMSDDGIKWNSIYLFMSFFMLILIINTLFLTEVEDKKFETTQDKKLGNWFLNMILEPLKDFFIRFGTTAILILLFIMLFKVGEAFLGRMSLVFYKDIGFTTGEIATYSKLVGSTLTIIFSIMAGFITIHYGLVKGLFISGIAMAMTNLIYGYMAITGADTNIFALAILLDNFTTAFSTVAFVSFISYLTNKAYSATQYALMSSAGNLGRTIFAGSSGFLVDGLDNIPVLENTFGENSEWMVFFIITALMVIPSLIMLKIIAKKLKGVVL